MTYRTECNLEIARCFDSTLRLKSEGACPKATTAPSPSPASTPTPKSCIFDCSRFKSDPVCGTDGVTYNNVCTLANASCNNPNVTMKSFGECKTSKTKLRA
ncbi:TPA: hypothetical protein N0F65_004628 [Lagenidium giganteum]|uniref:Kazal-like domain-containing protein n=1 Tax=Lagenidium giganteum TaxID=4803 RepID=A0AAV2ZAM9_9STRA|nr:TPA: hypothetical protein N0F65_004628 [Lagenidium giganteum]